MCKTIFGLLLTGLSLSFFVSYKDWFASLSSDDMMAVFVLMFAALLLSIVLAWLCKWAILNLLIGGLLSVIVAMIGKGLFGESIFVVIDQDVAVFNWAAYTLLWIFSFSPVSFWLTVLFKR